MRAAALIAALLCLGMAGCARPDRVETFKSPTAGIYLTVDTYNGGPGPLGSDYTRVFAHFERQGKSARALVLGGDSLTVSRIIWDSPDDDTLCINSDSFTDSFSNQVTLIVGNSLRDSVTIHSRLREHCPQPDLGGRKRAVPSRPNQVGGGPAPE